MEKNPQFARYILTYIYLCLFQSWFIYERVIFSFFLQLLMCCRKKYRLFKALRTDRQTDFEVQEFREGSRKFVHIGHIRDFLSYEKDKNKTIFFGQSSPDILNEPKTRHFMGIKIFILAITTKRKCHGPYFMFIYLQPRSNFVWKSLKIEKTRTIQFLRSAA